MMTQVSSIPTMLKFVAVLVAMTISLVQTSATPYLSLVAGAGQRFESARRLFILLADP